MDRLSAARVFIDVAHTGSFSATAERLEMSRPMVTRYIEAIETWFDARLLHRTTRKVSLTSIGEQCLRDVEHWVEAAEQMANKIRPSDALSGAIRLSASTSFAYSRLMPALCDFMALHPKVMIDVDLQDNAVDLIKNRIDLAIRIASSPDPSLSGKPIATCRSSMVASASYLQNSPTIKKPADLSAHACLGYNNFERHVWHLRRAEQHAAVEVNCRLTANEATALMQAAIHGAGISLQPSYLVAPAIERGELLRVLPTWEPQVMDIYLLYPSRKHLAPTVRALIDFLSDYYQRHRWD